jgi:leader peptidase (prepilin peptidase) / N-methyltransferase
LTHVAETGVSGLSRTRLRALSVLGSGAAALLIAATLVRFGVGGRGVAWATAQVLLAFIAVFDIATRRVPNRVTVPAALAIVVLRAVFTPSSLVQAAVAGAAAFIAFLLIALLTRGGMGMGDVKLAGLLGLLLGRAALPALLVGIILGGIASGLVILARRGGRGHTIAYAPYLCLGGAVAILAFSVPAFV